MKKVLLLLLTTIMATGCSKTNNVKVNSVDDYVKNFASENSEISNNDDDYMKSALIKFGEDSEISILGDSKDGAIKFIELKIDKADIGTDAENHYLNGLYNYMDSLNSNKNSKTEYSDLIKANLQDSLIKADVTGNVTLIDNSDVNITTGVARNAYGIILEDGSVESYEAWIKSLYSQE